MLLRLERLASIALLIWIVTIVAFVPLAIGAFAVLDDRVAAGNVVSAAFKAVNYTGAAVCLVAGACWVALAGDETGRFRWVIPRVGLAAIALALTIGSVENAREMAAMRELAGPIERLPVSHPTRVRFEWLHVFSVRTFGVVAAMALAMLVLDRLGASSRWTRTPTP